MIVGGIILQIIVDEDKCIGCGKCEEICPKAAKIWKINRVAHTSWFERIARFERTQINI